MIFNRLNSSIKKRLLTLLIGGSLSFASAMVLALTNSDFSASPPIISSTSKPLVMLALSNDHQLYFKSYSDYGDLDGDGTPEITYTHSIDYVGYFDPYKCYSYSSGRFNPDNVTNDKYCAAGTGQWSGNFLNWATMTRVDQIRKVLYGGFRRIDTSTLTVLERSFLTTDAHSFAKYYDGTDIEKLTPYNPATQGAGTVTSGMTFCNTTYVSSGESQNIDASAEPPLLRIVEGNYSLWAGGEVTQCRFDDEPVINDDGDVVDSGRDEGGGSNNNNSALSEIQAYANSPDIDDRIADLNVRVSVCVSGLEEENCVKYPTSTHEKPTGFLQSYGDSEKMYFGLMSGSYFKNKSGGVLRKNVSSFTDEVNVLTDGTFKTAPATGGIVSTIDAFRITGYSFSSKGYGGDSCNFNKGTFVNGECKSWGNPFAEIMLECYRYFAEGTSANPSFASADSGLISALQTQTWANPMTVDTSCGQISIIAFNASTTSYDGDELSGVSDLVNGGKSAKTLTDEVGVLEGINGNDYYVGRVDGAGNTLCSAKTVSTLGGVDGTCPDSPRLEGTHKLAGLAYHVFKTDIRPDLPGKQLVNTYGVSLAPSVPSAILPVPNTNKTVEVLPACNNTRVPTNGAIEGNCALVEFKILQLPTEVAGVVTAKYYVNWESASQGGDFDQDLWGVIDVSVTETTVTVTTDAVAESTGAPMGFGYIISGTNKDGFHAHSGIEGYDYQFDGVDECNNCQVGNAATSQTYVIGNSTASLLEDPLFYAAKYGGFNDINGDGTPDTVDEWDVKDTNGNIGSDGIPDNYFPITNPLQLAASIRQVLDAIDASLVSSSAAAVVANSSSGVGAIYQGLYYPEYKASNADSVNWVGMMQAVFRDENGYLREDTNQNGALDDYNVDYPIVLYYDDVLERSRVQRYQLKNNADLTQIDDDDFEVKDIIEVEAFKPIWNARNELAKLDNDTQIKAQRSYSTLANPDINVLGSGGRYIFTGIDADNNGLVEQGETFAFDKVNFPATVADNNYRYLGLDSTNYTQAPDIVNFIRGYEGISGYRTRAVDYDGDGTEEIWRLGDFIHSEPASVSSPNANYDSLYGDESYRAFRQKYTHRRQVLYVGGNDGMLHAFNAGFYNRDTQSFDTVKPDDSTATPHSLGSELWAYVPMNALPHLRWLTLPDYQHVYYVDGSPRVYDVNIFTEDDDHPGGWGTILVVGMRLGGGDITLDPDSDDNGSDADNDDITTRSAFIIMDITNPEKPPELIAEIAHTPDGADFGYTTSKPVIVKRRIASDSGSFASPSYNDWLMVFGSGPTGANALTSVVSDENAKLFLFDLKTKTFVSGFSPDPIDPVAPTPLDDNRLDSHPASYIGDMAKADWNNDYTDDAVYFGMVAGTAAAPDGALKRLGIDFDYPNQSSLITLLDTNSSVVNAPRMAKDEFGSQWVYAGTGRYLASDDNDSAATQYFYGVIENKPDATVSKSDMVNVTDFQVFTSNPSEYSSYNYVVECEWPCANGGSSITITNTGSIVSRTISSWQDLRDAISKTNGWYRELDISDSVTGTSAGRALGPTNLLGPTLLFVEYAPSDNQCSPIGYSRLFAVNYQTGTASPYARAGISNDVADLANTNFGPQQNLLMLGGDGEGDGDNANGDGTTGNEIGGSDSISLGGIPFPSGRRSWKEINIDWNLGL